MSTILDALRKAQDETGEQRAPRGTPLPGEVGPPPRRERPRRSRAWLVTAIVVLVAAVAGGLTLGDRLGLRSGGSRDGGDTAAPTISAAETTSRAEQGLPARAGGARPVPGEADSPAAPDRVAALHPEGARAPARAAARRAELEPTPAGELEVIEGRRDRVQRGAAERSERLKELRERVLEARREAQARAAAKPAQPPIPILTPPANAVAAGERNAPPVPPEPAGGDVAPAALQPAGEPIVDALRAEPQASALARRASEVAAAPHADQVPPPPAQARPADQPLIDDATLAALAAHGRGAVPPPAPEEATGAVAGAELPSAAPAGAGADAGAEGAQRHEAPVALAAVKRAPAPAEPPVLRRPPGGAPQVSINILQWSAEPTRRFAFVTVDGGNVTQIREGDRIGGLTVKRIYEQMIEFGFNDTSFMLRAN